MSRFWVALGGNLGDREALFARAVKALESHADVELLRGSAVYETPPFGPAGQERYWNAVVEGRTELGPLELLRVCQSIENDLGRTREIRWGPRTMDLDLLLMEDLEYKSEELVLPHPRIEERAFVLRPLCDLIPDWNLAGGAVRECLAGLSEEGIVPVRESILECR